MRCSPLALLSDSKHIVTDCSLTNPHPINIQCSQIYVHACRMALQGHKAEDIFQQCLSMVKEGPVYGVLQQVIKKERRDITHNKGHVLNAVYCSFWCLLYYTRFEDAMEWVITQEIRPTGMGDTDTNGAVAGALIGCIIGYEKLLTEPKTRYTLTE